MCSYSFISSCDKLLVDGGYDPNPRATVKLKTCSNVHFNYSAYAVLFMGIITLAFDELCAVEFSNKTVIPMETGVLT